VCTFVRFCFPPVFVIHEYMLYWPISNNTKSRNGLFERGNWLAFDFVTMRNAAENS